MAQELPLVRIARCQCGAIAAHCSREPWRVSLCHCFACKARSGSAFALNATFDERQVELVGEARTYERRGEDGGHWVRQWFCGTCGTTLYYRIEQRPGAISVAIGCFGTRDFPPPAYEVYVECAMAGLNLRIEPKPEQQ